MKIAIEAAGASAKGGGTTVRFVPQDARGQLVPAVSEKEFSGKLRALLHLRHERELLVGLGERAKINAHALRIASGVAAMFLKKIGHTSFTVNLEDWPQFAGPVAEGVGLADYRFELFKTAKTAPLEKVRLHIPREEIAGAKRAARRGHIIAEATNACRDIGNLPGNVLYPETLAERAVQLAKARGLGVTVFDERRLRAGKFGGILSVGEGSARGPRMIMLEHRGGPKSQRPLALVGKAITFDTGGISIKQAAGMEEMIFDKCGGMAVLGAMAAIADLGLKRNVVAVIASAENMPGAAAYRPGDIVTAYDGKHIEIINTDAEGRVVLADAIGYARKDLKAAAIIDLATLTGACGVALGEYAAGLWSNDDAFHAQVLAASQRAGERLWPMPMFSEYDDQIKSDVALIKNSGGRLGGACTGAAFLKTFAENTPWAHLDIAYMASREKDQAHLARGATGFGVRTLVELVENWDAAASSGADPKGC